MSSSVKTANQSLQQIELLTFDQTSLFLNLTKSKLRSMIFKNEIPVIRIGRCLRFNKGDLAQWLCEKKNYSFNQ